MKISSLVILIFCMSYSAAWSYNREVHLLKGCDSNVVKYLKIFDNVEPTDAKITPSDVFVGRWLVQEYYCKEANPRPYYVTNSMMDLPGFLIQFDSGGSIFVDHWSNFEKAWMFELSNLSRAYRMVDKNTYIVEKRDELGSGYACHAYGFCIYGYSIATKVND